MKTCEGREVWLHIFSAELDGCDWLVSSSSRLSSGRTALIPNGRVGLRPVLKLCREQNYNAPHEKHNLTSGLHPVCTEPSSPYHKYCRSLIKNSLSYKGSFLLHMARVSKMENLAEWHQALQCFGEVPRSLDWEENYLTLCALRFTKNVGRGMFITVCLEFSQGTD
jgi:hypothetical protein